MASIHYLDESLTSGQRMKSRPVRILRLADTTSNTFSSVQFSSVAQSHPTLCNSMDCSTPDPLSFTNSRSLLMSIESVMLSNHLILFCPILLLPSIFLSIRVFSNQSVLRIRWPKYWNFSLSTSSSNEYSTLISFRMDWFDLLAVQRILKSSPTPQFKSIIHLVLSLLYGPTLTSIHVYWKNHSFDQMDLCWQSDVSAF